MASMQLDPEDFYRSSDMAMVTYLKLNGHPVQQVLWMGDTCTWVFRVTDPLLDATEDFLAYRARVEPREYNKKFNETRKEFFESRELTEASGQKTTRKRNHD
jgi:hypothetical protein